MARSVRRPCAAPGCRRLATSKYHCDEHAAQAEARERERQARNSRLRPSPHVQGYGAPWFKARRAYLREHPRCIICHAPSTTVDHRVPHRGDPALMWDRANWQPMCRSCHSRKTAATDGGFGNPRR